MQNVNFGLYLHCNCENSSVGRAQPCQGWGRGFESRFSLNGCPDGGMVDTQDLKSCGHRGCAGSSPAPGTEDKPLDANQEVFFCFIPYHKGINKNRYNKKSAKPLINQQSGALIEAWSHLGLNQGLPDYESGALTD